MDTGEKVVSIAEDAGSGSGSGTTQDVTGEDAPSCAEDATVSTAMDKLDGDVIDFSALERELRSAVESDQRYQRVNDAKFRAINQKVASYQEFREIVLACHLRPLEKKDKNSASHKHPWNPLVTPRNHSFSISPSNSSPPAPSRNIGFTGSPDP